MNRIPTEGLKLSSQCPPRAWNASLNEQNPDRGIETVIRKIFGNNNM